MLYYLHLFEWWFSPFRVFKYVTVRAVAGAGTAFLFCLIAGPWIIAQLRRLNVGQIVRNEEAPPLYALHGHKQGTPTMGGLMIISAILFSVLLWAVPVNLHILITLATMCWMAMIGFMDDYTKVAKKRSKGLTARRKLALQTAWGLAIAAFLMLHPETSARADQLMIPFFKNFVVQHIHVALVFAFVTLVIVGASNAVNLTDGLDGLAIGCSSSAAMCYLVLSYVAGHSIFASYLKVPYILGASELTVFCGCMAGACLGFLWHNCHPASVFMGDTGSLALGGTIAIIAILIKQEILLIVVGGIFVIEAMSVILQVISFKLRGKRIFAMAPIHHHFEMRKWSETQVTVRFWILSIIFALIGILSLKIR